MQSGKAPRDSPRRRRAPVRRDGWRPPNRGARLFRSIRAKASLATILCAKVEFALKQRRKIKLDGGWFDAFYSGGTPERAVVLVDDHRAHAFIKIVASGNARDDPELGPQCLANVDVAANLHLMQCDCKARRRLGAYRMSAGTCDVQAGMARVIEIGENGRKRRGGKTALDRPALRLERRGGGRGAFGRDRGRDVLAADQPLHEVRG